MEQSYLSRLRFDPKLHAGVVASYLRNFRLTILLLLAIIFLGIVSYTNLPKRLNPEVKIPIVTVTTILPGAGPEDVESLITIPIENSLQSLEGVTTIQSVSRENTSIISIQFSASTDRDAAKDLVKSQVDTVLLPSDAQDPSVAGLDFENVPVWQFVLYTNDDIASLQTFARHLKTTLEDDPKIDNVKITGLEEEEIVVELNQERVSEFGFNPLLISQAIRAGIAAYPAGTIDTARNSFVLTIEPAIQSLEDIRSIRLSLQGLTVSLGDIATVARRSKPQQQLTYIAKQAEEPKRAITFNVFKTRTTTITDAAYAAENIINQELSLYNGQFRVETISNTAQEITTQFEDLLKEFRTTILLVFACLFIFLGLRQAIISSLTIPLAFLSAFAIMPYVGMSINFLTLFAFLLALGLLVDDAIVVISAMTTYYKTGKFTPRETGLMVWRDTITPIWSTTITTIWSFIPLLLASGIIGEFIKPIPIVVTIIMISSTAIAVFITLPIMVVILKPEFPQRVVIFGKMAGILATIAALFFLFGQNILFPLLAILYVAWALVVYRVWRIVLHISKKKILEDARFNLIHAFFQKSTEHGIISIDGLALRYKRLISRILASKSARRNVVIAIVTYAVIGFALVPLGLVQNEFFPKTDTDQLFLQIELPQGTIVERTESEMLKILKKVKELPESEFVVAQAGVSAPANFGSQGSSGNNIALLTIRVNKDTVSTISLAEKLRADFIDEPQVSVLERSSGPPAGADLQMKLLGQDLTLLNSYADQLMQYLQNKNGITNPQKSIKPGTSAVIFVPDRDKLARFGLSPDSIGLWTRTYASGFSLGEIFIDSETTEKMPIRFTFGNDRATVESLGRVKIPAQQEFVPLLSLGLLQLKTNPTIITREDGKRTITVTAGVRPGFNVTQLNAELEKYADSLSLPDGYKWKTGGVNEENAKSVRSILQAMGVAALLILVTMVVQFGSFRQAIIVLSVIPLAVSSVFYAFGITATPLSFPALIGVLSLFGIVVKNSMFIVDKINLNQKEGMPFDEALSDAGASRLEPIVLTKLSTALGLLPITIADPLWRGLGGAIISGLLIASSIMLLFIPVVYYQWMKPKNN
jgi:HAE1 family hydrophobic/amphiphilic exporter-1